MKFLFYEGRHGERHLTEHTPAGWEFLKNQMQQDNNASFEDILRDSGPEAFYGSFDYKDDASLFIDDGGRISTIELTEVR